MIVSSSKYKQGEITMKIGTMSVIVGNSACNARCPFCISDTTPTCGVQLATPSNINWRNFHKCCNCAVKSGAMTVLLTGKGEPTLWPDLITKYLISLEEWQFPFIELQTNGILLQHDTYTSHLEEWYKKGLSTICLSIVSTNDFENAVVYQPSALTVGGYNEAHAFKLLRGEGYRELVPLIDKLHNIGFTVRLTCMLMKRFLHNSNDILSLINFCKEHKVKQLTARPITVPDGANNSVAEFIREQTISPEELASIDVFLKEKGRKTLTLSHGDNVYDIDGQNFCWGSCVTTSETCDNIRQIIFYPDGTIRYDWKYTGSILL